MVFSFFVETRMKNLKTAYLSLGSNLGNKIENLQKAIIGFVVISEEQANNPSPIKGLMVY